MASGAAGWAAGELELGGTVSGSDIGVVLVLGRELEDSSGGHDDESKDHSIDLHGVVLVVWFLVEHSVYSNSDLVYKFLGL